MFNFVKNSLATKISLFTSFLVFLTAVLVAYVFFISSREVLIEKEFQLLRDESFLIKDKVKHIDHFLQKQVKVLKKTSQQVSESRDILTEDDFDGILDHEYKNWMEVQDYNATISFLSDENGEMGIARQIRSDKARLYDINKESLNKAFHNKKERSLPITLATYNSVLLQDNGHPIPVVHYVVNLASGKAIVSFELANLFENFLSRNFGQKTKLGQVIFFNRYGDIITHPNIDKTLILSGNRLYSIDQEFPILNENHFLKSGEDNGHIIQYRGSKHLIYLSRAPFISFVLLISEKEIYDNLEEAVFQISIMLSGLILLFAFIGWFLSRYFLKELGAITKIAKRFMEGEYNLTMPVNSNDEIGTLALTIQGLIRQVQEREKNLRRSERKTREARDHAEKTLETKSSLLEDIKRQKTDIENISKDKDDLLAIVSHDLKNPLAVVGTSMEIILEEDKAHLSQTSLDLIRRSQNSAKMAVNLITDLLDLARLEGEIKLDKELFYIKDLVESVVDTLYLVGKEKNLSLNTHYDGDFDIDADYGRINQVIANILGNACKFTPHNGTIDITVSEGKRESDDEPRLLQIVIQDDGPGIPADKVSSIFNKYEQARAGDRKIGTGLGLAICKKISDLHEGKIWVESEEGQGARFTILIPGLEDHALSTGRKETDDENVDQSLHYSRTVMVVDEDKSIREMVAEYFHDLEMNCIKAKSGAEALFLMKKYPVEVVLSDIRIPVIDGISMTKMIKKKYPATKVILCTSSFDKIPDKLIESLSVEEVISKPYDVESVAFKVKKALLSSMASQKKVAPAKKQEKEVKTEVVQEEKKETVSNVVVLPKAEDRPKETVEKPAAIEHRVLVIDDSDDMHALFKVLLKKQTQIDLSHALSGREALELIKENDYGVVFIDMNMPEMSGKETLVKIKEYCDAHKKTVPFSVLLTANELDQKVVTQEMGFHLYLKKPISKSKILGVLEEKNAA